MNRKEIAIILGTAHLATTPGKSSPDGRLREYAYSRKIAGSVAEALRAKGYTVYIDYMAPNPSPQMKSASWKQEQNRELAWRANFVNSVCAKYGNSNCVYVSIHLNAAGNGQWMSARGWEAWTSKGQTQGDKLADCLYDAAKKYLPQGTKIRTDMSDGDKDKEAQFAVLTKTKCPAVLTENLFQDNKEDVEYLLSDRGEEAIVRLHIDGIESYITKNYCKG